MKLSQKQKNFADNYIETANITESAIKAGYSKSYANAQGYKLLENVGIKAYIAERMAVKDAKKVAKEDEILEFLTTVLRGETTESIPITYRDGFEMVDNEPNIKDRIKASELLGKRYAMWTDKKDLTGNVNINFVDDLDD